MSGVLQVILAINGYSGDWTILNTPDTNVWALAVSSGGGTYGYLIAAGANASLTGIHLSTDGGSTWSNPRTADGLYYSLDVSSTGQYMAALPADATDNVAISTDYGVTWAEISNTPTGAYSQININESGSDLRLTLGNGTSSYIKKGVGSWTWSDVTGPGTANYWSHLSYNQALTYGLASKSTSSTLMRDNNGTWSQVTSLPDQNWTSLAVSETGQYMFAGGTSNSYASSDYGGTWGAAIPVLSGKTLTGCAIKGQKILVCANNVVYLSTNAGANWTEQDTPAIQNMSVIGIGGTGSYGYLLADGNLYRKAI